MDLKLKDKVVLINGATGGLGRAVCFALKAEGAKIALSGRDPEKVAALATELDLGPDRLWTNIADVTVEEQVKAYIDGAIEHFGHIDIVLPNAGYEGKWEFNDQLTKENFNKVFGINVLGVMFMLKYGGAALAAQGSGSIVITSSIGGVVGSPGMAIYCASKHAVQGLMKSAARELGPKGVSVKSINPDGIYTPMLSRIGKNALGDSMTEEERLAALTAGTYDKRAATPEEVAYLILYYASPWAQHIYGSKVVIDGANGDGDTVRP